MPTSSGARLHSLDGVRGLAALVVVVHHSLLAAPTLARAYTQDPPDLDGWAHVLAYTPMHLVWEGAAAVSVFFVLSGYVLTLPSRRRPMIWRSYYPSRLLRLYIPTTAAILFALYLFVLVPREARAGASWWINRHDTEVTTTSVLRYATLLGKVDYLNTALWSLRWEVVFSLLLPVFLLCAWRVGRRWPAALLVLVGMSAAGQVVNLAALTYLPMFGIGCVMAACHDEISVVVDRCPRRVSVPALIVATAVMMVSLRWVLRGAGISTGLVADLSLTTSLLGALLLVAVAIWVPSIGMALSHPSIIWLGTRSFSLYLIHEPIVVSVAMALPTDRQNWTFAIALPLSLLCAELFFRIVERPSHRLSRLVSVKTADRRADSAAGARA